MTNAREPRPISEMLDFVQKQTGWEREECRNFLRAISSKTKDGWLDDASAILEWATDIEAKQMLVTLAKNGAMTITFEDGEPAWALGPNVDLQHIDGLLAKSLPSQTGDVS